MITEGCPNVPKLDPRVLRTRRLLEDALRSLMKERHYSEISVAEIAERATVNRATFYAHFEDKDSLVATLVRREMEAVLLEAIHKKGALNAEALVDIATAVFKFIERINSHCPKAKAGISAVMYPTLQNTIQDFLHTSLKRDPAGIRLFPGSSVGTVATVLSWSIFGGAKNWSQREKRGSAEEAAKKVVSFLLAGRAA